MKNYGNVKLGKYSACFYATRRNRRSNDGFEQTDGVFMSIRGEIGVIWMWVVICIQINSVLNIYV